MKKVGRKPEFEMSVEAFIEITSEKANVDYVNSQIKEIWGSTYSLVSADGHKVADCSATRGN